MSANEVVNRNVFGFCKDYEVLPNFDKFDNIGCQRALFLEFFNNQNKDLKFEKQEIKKYKKFKLRDIFSNKIFLLLNFKSILVPLKNHNIKAIKLFEPSVQTFLQKNNSDLSTLYHTQNIKF